jgi:hypothetical protein
MAAADLVMPSRRRPVSFRPPSGREVPSGDSWLLAIGCRASDDGSRGRVKGVTCAGRTVQVMAVALLATAAFSLLVPGQRPLRYRLELLAPARFPCIGPSSGQGWQVFFNHRLSPRSSSDCCPEGRSSFLHPARFPAWVGILQPRGHSPCSEAVPRCSRYQPLVLALESHNTSQCVTFTQHAPLRRALQSRCWRESSSVSLFGLTNLVSPGSFSPQI